MVTLTTKLNDLTKNIDDHNRSSVESTDRLDKQIKRIKEAPQFKHKYNKAQYDLNHNIESLEDISDLLSKNKVDAAEKKLKEAIVKLKKRNKLINRKLDGTLPRNMKWIIWPRTRKMKRKSREPNGQQWQREKSDHLPALLLVHFLLSLLLITFFVPNVQVQKHLPIKVLPQELPTGRINRETDALVVENLDIGEENAEPSRISMLTPNLSNQHSCRVSKTNNGTLHQQNRETKKLSSLKSTEVKYNLDSFDGDRDKFFVENEIEALKQFDYEKDLYEFEQFQKPVTVKGRLNKQNLKYWEDIGASDFIISTISEGYKIPFIDSPEPAEFKNNRSAIHNSEFVSDSLRELIASKLAVEVPFKPTVVNPLSVSRSEVCKPSHLEK